MAISHAFDKRNVHIPTKSITTTVLFFTCMDSTIVGSSARGKFKVVSTWGCLIIIYAAARRYRINLLTGDKFFIECMKTHGTSEAFVKARQNILESIVVFETLNSRLDGKSHPISLYRTHRFSRSDGIYDGVV